MKCGHENRHQRPMNRQWARYIGPYECPDSFTNHDYCAFTGAGWRVVLTPYWLERFQPLALPLCLPLGRSMSRVIATWII